MSTSGVTNYSVTELEVITAILSKLGVAQDGQTLNASDVVKVRVNLNMIYKQWVAQADFAPGLKMWTRRRAYLFLQDDKIQYSVGPTGDECASESYVTTTLSTDSISASLNLTDTTDFVIGMRVGVVLTTGIQWTTVNGLNTGSISVADTITASSGSVVFGYVAKPVRPFEIVAASLRDQNGDDTPIDPNLSVSEYELIPSKHTIGSPSKIYFEAKTTNAQLYIDRAPEDLTKVIRLVFHSYVEDTTAQTQDVDFPAEWFRALVGQGVMDSAADFGRPMTPDMKLFRDEALAMAKDAYPSTSDAYYQSDPDQYF